MRLLITLVFALTVCALHAEAQTPVVGKLKADCFLTGGGGGQPPSPHVIFSLPLVEYAGGLIATNEFPYRVLGSEKITVALILRRASTRGFLEILNGSAAIGESPATLAIFGTGSSSTPGNPLLVENGHELGIYLQRPPAVPHTYDTVACMLRPSLG